jgi:hypothetical protein
VHNVINRTELYYTAGKKHNSGTGSITPNALKRATIGAERRIASDDSVKGYRDTDVLKQALFERIEDEYDIAAAAEAYAEYERSGRKSRPISELWKELDL